MKARYLLSTQQFKDLCIWLFWLSAYAAFCVLFTHLLKQLGALLLDSTFEAAFSMLAAFVAFIGIGIRIVTEKWR